jgi:hypothetical protein
MTSQHGAAQAYGGAACRKRTDAGRDLSCTVCKLCMWACCFGSAIRLHGLYPVTWHVLCNSVLLVQALCNEVCLSARYGFGGVIYFYERVRDAHIWWVVFQLRSHGKVLLTDKTPVCWSDCLRGARQHCYVHSGGVSCVMHAVCSLQCS